MPVKEPQDRKAPARRAPARRPVAEPAADEIDRLEVEAEALDTDWQVHELAGDEIRFQPYGRWPKNVWRSIRNTGDFEALARVMHPDDVDIWDESDATLEDVSNLVNALMESSGQDAGESRASRRSRQRTARR